MPSNIGVVDAFKSESISPNTLFLSYFLLDLIRHGKAHQDDGDSDIPAQTLSQPHNHQRERCEPASIIREPKHNEPTKSPHALSTRSREELQAKTKMPTCKGLERFLLLDKYVFLTSLSSISNTALFQWHFFKCVQSSRPHHRLKGCWLVVVLVQCLPPYTLIRSANSSSMRASLIRPLFTSPMGHLTRAAVS
jgi:hypothetical protein